MSRILGTGRIKIVIALLGLAVIIGGGLLTLPGHLGHDDPAGAGEEKTQYTCGMHPFIIQDEPGLCPICGMGLTPVRAGAADLVATEKKISHWASPMDPTYIRDEPGQDYMGHDLVPVYEDGAASAGTIRIDPVTIQNMGLRTERAERRDITRSIRTVGRIDYDESRRFMVNSKIDGWIERLHVRETGRQVRRGEPLLDIYSPELVAAQQEYLLALNNWERLAGNPDPGTVEGARRLLEASRSRLRLWDISAEQIAQLEKSRQVRKTMTLHAPVAGVVTDKMAFEGMAVKGGMELFRLADLSRVWVLAEVYEVDLPWLHPGQEALVELPFAPRQPLKARIDFIYPYLEGATRTQRVRLEVANPGLELKPEMFVNLQLEASSVREVVAVPVQAVLYSGTGQRVFVHLGEGRFEPRPVEVGLLGEEGWIEILSGLNVDEIVVTSAQFMLDSESRLQEAVQKMLQPSVQEPAPAHNHDENLEDLFN